ncbi:MAG: hypothetical protein M3O71_27995 [Bacteroidota bacterium]|nr:hypothetical protein [Bacteroidota bacterium]
MKTGDSAGAVKSSLISYKQVVPLELLCRQSRTPAESPVYSVNEYNYWLHWSHLIAVELKSDFPEHAFRGIASFDLVYYLCPHD